MRIIGYLIITLSLTSCIAYDIIQTAFEKQYHVAVPYNKNLLLDFHNNWFECVNCEDNYDENAGYYIKQNRIVGIPFLDDQIQDNELLLKLHNTIKIIGYKSLISNEFYNKNIKSFIDSVLIMNVQEVDTTNYFSKFLLRREKQNTKETTLKIIGDIKMEFEGVETIESQESFYSDHAQLIEYDLKLKQKNDLDKKEILLELFNHLKDLEQYHWAYQVISQPIDLSKEYSVRDSLLKTLPLDTISKNYTGDNYLELGYFTKDGAWHDYYLEWHNYDGP